MDNDSRTSLTLLQLLRSSQAEADTWQTFVDRYGGRIYQWCLARKLQPSDAEDVTQNVLLNLARKMKEFEHDRSGSFRAWLRRVTENALIDFLRERRRHSIEKQHLGQLDQAEAKQDLMERMSDAFDLELFEFAVRRVKCRVKPDRFRAWKMAAMEGRSGAEVAATLRMKVATVYTAKNQVQNLLSEELKSLEQRFDSSI